MPMVPYSETTDPRAVNNLLHTLRGEQFRHSQNVRRSRTHISSTTRHGPTLPIDLTSPNYTVQDTPRTKPGTSNSCPGPGPPKSWILTSEDVVRETARAWRAQALSFILSHLHPFPKTSLDLSIPPLTQLCLDKILASSIISDFGRSVVPFLPPHIRRDLIRHTAITSPLPDAMLYPMFEPEGHVDNELIVVGPNATLRDDYFIHSSHGGKRQDTWDWDTERAVPEPMSTLILMSIRLAVSTMLTLPPTITHLALIDLASPIPLHRLPGTCPMLVILDLSYNRWLENPAKDILESVEWSRWNNLRILGLRGCQISNEMRLKLNKVRWDDVEIVQ